MKRGMSLLEVVIAVVLIAGVAFVFVPAFFRPRASARPSCQNNLKQFGLVFKMYANESKGERFPPMNVTVDDVVDCDQPAHAVVRKGGYPVPAPRVSQIYPEYISDPLIFACPAIHKYVALNYEEFPLPCAGADKGQRFAARDYVYLGWAYDLTGANDEAVEYGGTVGPRQMTETLLPLVMPWMAGTATERDVAAFDADLTTKTDKLGNGHLGKTVYRLREGIERFVITDINDAAKAAEAQSRIWVMADRPHLDKDGGIAGAHTPVGANVLCFDGHVEFQALGKPTNHGPMNTPVARFLTTVFRE